MIVVDVKLVEISQTKMQKLGVSLTTFDGQQIQKADGKLAFQQIPSAASTGFVEALLKNHLARLVADPRIAAISGQEARLSVGSQSEASQAKAGANEQLGIELQLTPTLLSDNRVQMDLFLKYSWQEKVKDNSETETQVRHFSLDTTLASTSRESSILSELVPGSADTSFLVIVTPEVVESTAAAP
jgi:type II secretory pathway component GspD/PulD (secretin)